MKSILVNIDKWLFYIYLYLFLCLIYFFIEYEALQAPQNETKVPITFYKDNEEKSL